MRERAKYGISQCYCQPHGRTSAPDLCYFLYFGNFEARVTAHLVGSWQQRFLHGHPGDTKASVHFHMRKDGSPSRCSTQHVKDNNWDFTFRQHWVIKLCLTTLARLT